MTFVGKVLVVVQVVFSVCFMAFAGAVFSAHQNWKTAYDEQKTIVSEARESYATLEEDSNKYKDEMTVKLDDQTKLANKLANDKRILDQRVKNLETELTTAKTDRDTQRAAAEISGEEAKRRREEAVKQRVANAELHKKLNEVTAEVRSLQDELFNNQVKQKSVAEKYNQMLVKLAFLQRIVNEHNLPTDPNLYVGKSEIPPLVSGLVLDSRKADRGGTHLIKVSIGSDDGLKQGHKLFVYRPGVEAGRKAKYLGMIEIVYVTPDTAVGKVIERAKNGIIEKDDNVSTKI